MTDASPLIAEFVRFGLTGLVLWWMTQKFIPDLMKTFREEAAAQRQECNENVEKIMTVHQKAIDGMMAHMEREHQAR